MESPPRPSGHFPLGQLIFIGAVVAAGAGAFAYTAGWLSPDRISPNKVVAAFAPPGGPALGHRRNHTKGICFTGAFEANGMGQQVSSASMLASGRYPIIGRFNIGSPNIKAPDGTVRVRGMGLQIVGPDGQIWRMAMIDPPFFPVSTPQVFYGMLQASGSKDPGAVKTFAAAHPEFARFGAWASAAPWTGSYAEEPYNSLDSFTFINSSGVKSVVRWSLTPTVTPVPLPADQLSKEAPDFLEQEIVQRIKGGPMRWTMRVTVSNPGDPTADPSIAWPAARRTVEVGTLVVNQIEQEPNGPCRDIVYDPTLLPAGMAVSDDPFPAARSSAYRRSDDLRTAEAKDYPRTSGTSQ